MNKRKTKFWILAIVSIVASWTILPKIIEIGGLDVKIGLTCMNLVSIYNLRGITND